jgi:hypothetical protein
MSPEKRKNKIEKYDFTCVIRIINILYTKDVWWKAEVEE